MTHDYRFARERMVKNQLIPAGSRTKRFWSHGEDPRHLFVEEALVGEAYNDHPLPIGDKQTISQPYIVALMTEALELKGRKRFWRSGRAAGTRPPFSRNSRTRLHG